MTNFYIKFIITYTTSSKALFFSTSISLIIKSINRVKHKEIFSFINQIYNFRCTISFALVQKIDREKIYIKTDIYQNASTGEQKSLLSLLIARKWTQAT